MLSEHCRDCRFLAAEGCRKGMCAVVRCHRHGERLPVPETPVEVLTPECASPLGIAGFVVDGTEFPPTAEGYITARGLQGQLEAIYGPTEFKELRTEGNKND